MPRKNAAALVPANETPRKRFVRLAKVRTNKVLGGLEGLEQLARYDYEDKHVDQIEAVIKQKMEHAIKCLREKRAPRGPEFELED